MDSTLSRAGILVGMSLALCGVTHAGHEFPFYPSFYPQEITVEALDARAAAARIAKGTLHVYAGAEIAAQGVHAKFGAVSTLGGYVVVDFDPRAAKLADAGARCASARGLKDALGEGYVRHPYPVTPFHGDYLRHADLAAAARAADGSRESVRLLARGAAAERLLREQAVSGTPAEGRLEVVDLGALIGRASTRYNGWSGPPWIRQGWFHAYLLLADSVSDRATRARVDEVMRRLVRGEHRSFEERIDLERNLVTLLQSGCERVVLGFVVRRENYGTDYSQGVENVGHDALEGLGAAIFPRTVKLRDFPWNGWLSTAAPAAPASAWNPVVGGFGDPFGRLVWWAVADPAVIASPHATGWIENRVSASVAEAAGSLAVPADALAPEPGSGRLLPVGRDTSASARIVYRVRNSAFHDGTSMSVADVLYAYAFAAAWGAGNDADPGVARATALARERLKGVRLLRVEIEKLAFGEDSLRYEVPVIEVYLDARFGEDAIALAPPWSTLPWHLLALFDEGARRGLFSFSAVDATRRGLRELDAVRDPAVVQRLADLARELEERAHVPASLAGLVSAEEARARYHRLRDFHAAHGHWLVTNGPYKLASWDGSKAVLAVFRDPTYPKGLGSFNAYAVPLKGYVTRIEPRGDGAEAQVETELLERLGREVRIVRGSFAKKLAERVTGAAARPLPDCHYLLVGEDGAVAAAGTVRSDAGGTCRIDLARAKRTSGAGRARLMVAAVLDGNMANAPVKIVPWNR